MNTRTRGIYVGLCTTSYVIIPHLSLSHMKSMWANDDFIYWGARRCLFLVGLCIICAPAHSLDLRSPHSAPFPLPRIKCLFWSFLRVIVSLCQRELGVDKFQTQDIYRYFVGYKYFVTKPNITIGYYQEFFSWVAVNRVTYDDRKCFDETICYTTFGANYGFAKFL